MEKRQEKGAEGHGHCRAQFDSQHWMLVRTIICIYLCRPGLSIDTFHNSFCNSRLAFLREKKIANRFKNKSLAIVKESMFLAQMGNYLPELGLIYPLFSKDLMIPSRWHFLRKVCRSDPLHHPGPAQAIAKGGGGREDHMDMFSEGDRKQNRIHCPLHLHFAPLGAPLRTHWARQGVSRSLHSSPPGRLRLGHCVPACTVLISCM